MAKKGEKKPFRNADDPEAIAPWVRRFLEHQRVRNYSERTVVGTESSLRCFIEWADDRDLVMPGDVTKPILESYQRWLFYFRKPSGKALTFSSQRVRIQKLRVFFRWLARQNVIPSNPASDLEMPRIERRIPKAILNEREIEKVLAQADTTDVVGLRDRAMMEVLYSTGIRRHELGNIELFDIDPERGTLTVRQGKGRKDRTVPIGARALEWVARYVQLARPMLVAPPEHPTLFLSERGERLNLGCVTNLMTSYVDRAKVGKRGACHIFRHSMATHMLERGADVRHIQEMLGHAETSTTAIYTRVSIQHLKRVHDATHPTAHVEQRGRVDEGGTGDKRGEEVSSAELLFSLAAEASEEVAEGESGGAISVAKTLPTPTAPRRAG